MSATAKVVILQEVRRAVLGIAKALELWIAALQGKEVPGS